MVPYSLNMEPMGNQRKDGCQCLMMAQKSLGKNRRKRSYDLTMTPPKLHPRWKRRIRRKKKKTGNHHRWPTIRLWSLKINASRTRSLIDVVGVHYGPYASEGFQRYLEQKDKATGFPWLCITIEFVDRTLDLVCKDTSQVTTWFLGIQALAPLSVHYLSKGAMLWQRLIMLLNFHGFDKLLNPQFPWIGPLNSQGPLSLNDRAAAKGGTRTTFLPTVQEEPHGTPSSPSMSSKSASPSSVSGKSASSPSVSGKSVSTST